MKFPKNHSLLKYANDITQYGVISNFSTTHSERQHQCDSKDPAKHLNHAQGTATKQVCTNPMEVTQSSTLCLQQCIYLAR